MAFFGSWSILLFFMVSKLQEPSKYIAIMIFFCLFFLGIFWLDNFTALGNNILFLRNSDKIRPAVLSGIIPILQILITQQNLNENTPNI